MSEMNRRGEIWLAEIKGKRRPVVVVNNESTVVEVDRVVATVTSQQPRNEYDIPLKHWQEAGLDKPSVVRCSKINTLHYKELIFKIGRLSNEDMQTVLSKIRDFFSV